MQCDKSQGPIMNENPNDEADKRWTSAVFKDITEHDAKEIKIAI